MVAVPLDFHRTDQDSPLGIGKIERIILNWQNRVTEGGLVIPADQDVANDDAPYSIDIGGDTYRFELRRQAAFTFLAGELDNPTNKTLMGFHLSDRPNAAMFIRARNVTAAGWEKITGEKAIRFVGIKTDTTLYATHRSAGIKTACKLNSGSAPTDWEWDAAVPAAVTCTEVDEGWLLEAPSGKSIIVRKALAWDATVGGLKAQDDPDFEPNVPVTSTLTRNTIVGNLRLLRFRFVLDTTAATFPVILDPEVLIASAGDIEDCFVSRDNGAWGYRNYGGATYLQIGRSLYVEECVSLVRVKASALPEDTHTALSLHLYTIGGSASREYASDVWFDYLKDAASWVSGSSINTIESGAACGYYQVHNSQPWPGAGLGPISQGTDFDATGRVIVSMTSGTVDPKWYQIDLDPAISMLWQNGGRVANGVVIRNGGQPTNIAYMKHVASLEGAVNPLYWKVTYGGAGVEHRAIGRGFDRGFGRGL